MKNRELEKIIEQSFGAEPDYHLPMDFANKVTGIISRSEESKVLWREGFSLAAILVLLLGIVPGIYYIVDREVLLESMNFLSNNSLSVIFIIIVLSFILLGDRVLLRFLFSRWSR